MMGLKMPTIVMKLYKIRLITTPDIRRGGFEPSYKVYCKYTLFYDSIKYEKPKFITGVPNSDFIPTFKQEETSKSKKKDKAPKEPKKKKKKSKKEQDEAEEEKVQMEESP